MKQPKRELSAKLRGLDTLSLKSMASGLRSMGRGGQRHLLKQIEAELARRVTREAP